MLHFLNWINFQFMRGNVRSYLTDHSYRSYLIELISSECQNSQEEDSVKILESLCSEFRLLIEKSNGPKVQSSLGYFSCKPFQSFVMSIQRHWIIAKKVVWGPKAEEHCRLEGTQNMHDLIVVPIFTLNNMIAKKVP